MENLIFDITAVESKIGYSFSDKMLLRKCFTHSSYAHEHCTESNERLEFFGDAIIEFIVTELLVKNFSGDEGKLTARRAEIVSNEALLRTVKQLGLCEFLLFGRGEAKKENIEGKRYASLYEALVAGIYLDGGLVKAKKFVLDTIFKDYERKDKIKQKNKHTADAKNAYQEYVQKRKLGSVSYETLSKKGPDHLPQFRVAALLNGARLAEGVGGSKKQAEAQAAERALDKLIKQEGSRS